MADAQIIEFLSKRIDGLENRLDVRMDRLETRLTDWMNDKSIQNGKQDMKIQRIEDGIKVIQQRQKQKNRRFYAIATVLAGVVAGLIQAIQKIMQK